MVARIVRVNMARVVRKREKREKVVVAERNEWRSVAGQRALQIRRDAWPVQLCFYNNHALFLENNRISVEAPSLPKKDNDTDGVQS
jgi:hypothetical protein